MAKNYMVSILEKRKPLFRGVIFFWWGNTQKGNYFFGDFSARRENRPLIINVTVIIESMKIPVPISIFSILSPSYVKNKWFILEPDGDLTLDSPSLFFLEACIVESFSFHPETKVSTILAETSGLEMYKA